MTTPDLLDRLIAFPTVSADSNLALIDWVSEYLAARGFVVHRVPDATGTKAGIYAVLGPEGPGGVMLSAHSDVVPAAGQAWTRDPFRMTAEGTRLYGRGTTDMKGFLAAMLTCADAASGRRLARPLKLAISYDEEVGCRGIAQMIDRLEPAIGLPELCIVGEPTRMQIAAGHKGKAAYRATCTGESGHSSMAPQFRNALHLGADLLAEIRAIQDDLARDGARDPGYDLPYSTIHVGRMQGGTALNIVPDLCTLEFEIRHLAAEPLGPLEARLDAAAARIAAAAGGAARIVIEKENAYPGLDMADDDPAVSALRALVPGAGVTRVAYGTEAGYFHALGVPTLVCGPGNMDQGHKPDEFIERAQLDACDAMMARLVERLSA